MPKEEGVYSWTQVDEQSWEFPARSLFFYLIRRCVCHTKERILCIYKTRTKSGLAGRSAFLGSGKYRRMRLANINTSYFLFHTENWVHEVNTCLQRWTVEAANGEQRVHVYPE